MAMTPAERQALVKERQKQLNSDQAKVIALQQTQIADLQSRVDALTASNHALEIKLLKTKQKAK